MDKYYQILSLLAELASEYGNNSYSVASYSMGFIPFKNGKNMVDEVGIKFSDIAKWLIDEDVKNFNEELDKKNKQV